MAFLKYFIAICLVFLVSVHVDAKLNLDPEQRIKLDQQVGHFEGDMQMKLTRNGIFKNKRWTDNTIPWEVREKDAGFKEPDYQEALLGAMKEIEDHTCIKFVPRTVEENYLVIFNGSGCYSGVGMGGGRQGLSLADGGCWWHGTIVHELLHAVGLWHEQSRHDRDQYIKINEDNIIKGLAYNFELKFENETSTYGIPYNYESVMHYSKEAFGKDGAVTIETLDPWFADLIGNREQGTDLDYEKVRRIYECPDAYPTMPTPTTTPPPPCENKYDACEDYKHECGKPGSFTNWACRVTCGHCSADCEDKITYCRDYFRDCKTTDWMKQACAKTCKFCSPF